MLPSSIVQPSVRSAFQAEGLVPEALLGRGGSGEVWRARRRGTGERIAVKTCLGDAAAELAFRREFAHHERLGLHPGHPHVMPVANLRRGTDGLLRYDMPWIDAVPLPEVRARGGDAALALVVLGVASALEHAHAHDIIHGDLKPQNILVAMSARGDVERVLLADFGDARRVGERDGRVTGTPAYWSPEQLNGWPADLRADFWALGVTIFGTLAGRPPFGDSDLHEILANLRAVPPRLREACPACDPRWADLVDALLQRAPWLRPPTAREIMRRVAPLAGREPPEEAASRPPRPALDPVGLEDFLASARDDGRAGRVTLVTGPPGTGKSRFLQELARRMQQDGVAAVSSDAREAPDMPLAVVRRVRHAGTVVDLGDGSHPSASLTDPDPATTRSFFLASLVERLLGEPGSARREGLFLVDSLERADADSVEIVERLARRIAGTRARVFVAVDAAAESVLARLAPACAPAIRLQPFGEEEMALLVAQHLDSPGGAPLDRVPLVALSHWLVREVGGLPGLVHGALVHLFEKGVLHRNGPAWTLDPKALDGIHLHAASGDVSTVLRRWTGGRRSLLERAALLGEDGRDFDPSLLSLGKNGAEDPVAFLGDACRDGLLVRTPASPPHFRFLRPQLARAVADRVAPTARRKWHARIVTELTTRPVAAPAQVLAYHLERSGKPAQAAATLAAAAAAAADAGAHVEADRLWRAAYALLGRRGTRSLVPFALAWLQSREVTGRYGDLVDLARELIEGLPRLGRRSSTERIRVHVLLARGLRLTARAEEAIEVLEEVLRTESLAADPAFAVLAGRELGQAETQLGRWDRAREALLRARSIAVEAGLGALAGSAEIALGAVEWHCADFESALEWLRSAESRCAAAGARDLIPSAWGHRAVCHWYLAETDLAATLHRRAAEEYLRRHRYAECARSLRNLAHVLTELGRFEEAGDALDRSDAICRADRDPRQRSFYEYGRARLALHRGRLEEATRRAESACDLARESGDTQVMISHGCLKALVELEAGRHDDAEATATRALLDAEKHGDHWGVAKCLFLIGSAQHRQGRLAEALAALDRAARVAADKRQPVAGFRVELARAAARAAAGDHDGARASLAAASRLQARAGSAFWDGLVHRTSADVMLAAGRPEEARDALARAYEIFAGLQAERWRGDTLFAQSRVWARLGRGDAARSAHETGRVLYRGLGLAPPPPARGVAEGHVAGEAATRLFADAASMLRRFLAPGSLDQVLDRIVDAVNAHLGTERVLIALLDLRTGRLQARAARLMDPQSSKDAMAISWSTVEAARTRGEPIVSNDALEDSRLNAKESVRALRIRSLAAIPLQAGGETIGALYADHRSLPGLFGPETVAVLRFLAELATVCIRVAGRLEVQERGIRHLRAEVEGQDVVLPDDLAGVTVIGSSPRMRALLRRGKQAAKAGRTILLTGPTGCGKDHFARILHGISGLEGGLHPVILTGVTGSLFLAEIFGVEKGAATDVAARAGRAERAQGGTLFLNEVGDLSPELQATLLDFLDRRVFQRVGSAEDVKFVGLVVLATNADLEAKVADGSFRADLYYRITGVTLRIPSLEDRIQDLPELAAAFLRVRAAEHGHPGWVLSADALEYLRNRRWPGNIRELFSVLDIGVDAVLADGSRVILREHLDPDPASVADAAGAPPPVPPPSLPTAEEAEIRLIEWALAETGGNVTKAAQRLGWTETKLRRRLEKYGLWHLATGRKGRNRRPRRPGNDGARDDPAVGSGRNRGEAGKNRQTAKRTPR